MMAKPTAPQYLTKTKFLNLKKFMFFDDYEVRGKREYGSSQADFQDS